MKYVEPSTIDEVVGLLAEHGSAAKVLAGGQSLLILLRERFVEPDVLIGLTGIEDLRRTEVNGEARVGAMVTHTEVERDTRIAQRWPLLTAAEAAVSTVQVRNRGTLCGNVAHGFPTADPPPALIACGARIVLRSRDRGEREVPAEEFFLGLMDTAAVDDELVTAVRLPPQPEGARSAYLKYAMRPLDFAIVNAAVRLTLAEDGTVADVRIGLGGAANHALRATDAEAVLRGESPSPEVLARAGDAAARQSEPLDDVDGSPGYKRRVIGVYTRRALAAALA